MSKVVAIVSGGMDSITLAHFAKKAGHDEVHGLGFNYGQRHAKELEFATKCSALTSYRIVNLAPLNSLLSASVLTDHSREVPDGHYAADNMKQTVVPNRNMIMLSIAAGYAVTIGANSVWTGVHGGDHFIYPDCRASFIGLASEAIYYGNEGFNEWHPQGPIIAPFVDMGKHDIAALGNELGVDYSQTWSCYKGGWHHCGRCGTCVERKEAFRLAKVVDPTVYEDPTFEIEAYRG